MGLKSETLSGFWTLGIRVIKVWFIDLRIDLEFKQDKQFKQHPYLYQSNKFDKIRAAYHSDQGL